MRIHMLHLACFLMAEAGADGGAGGGAADLLEVDLPGGVKIKLPKAEAAKVIAGRDELKKAHAESAAKLGEIQAKADAEAAKARKAEEDKALAAAASKGEIEEVRRLASAEGKAKLEKLAGKYRDTHLAAAIAQHASLLKLPDAAAQKALVADLVAQLSTSCRFNLESDSLEVIEGGALRVGADGKPMQVDAYINTFLDARPYLRQPSQSQGSGAHGTQTAEPGGTITRSRYEAATRDGDNKTLAAIADGKLKVVDG